MLSPDIIKYKTDIDLDGEFVQFLFNTAILTPNFDNILLLR